MTDEQMKELKRYITEEIETNAIIMLIGLTVIMFLIHLLY